MFEEMDGAYTLGADRMYHPNLELPEEEMPWYDKYGRMRQTYLREHKKAYHTTLLFHDKLVAYLNDIDDAANSRTELIIKKMCHGRTAKHERHNRIAMCHIQTAQYIAAITI